MYDKISNEVKSMSAEEGGYNAGKLWKLKKKLSPRFIDPPTAMKDSNGKLLTDNKDIKAEAMKHYKKVFDSKPIEDELKTHQIDRERLCQERLEVAYRNKTPSWSVEDVKCAIKDLNNGVDTQTSFSSQELLDKIL